MVNAINQSNQSALPHLLMKWRRNYRITPHQVFLLNEHQAQVRPSDIPDIKNKSTPIIAVESATPDHGITTFAASWADNTTTTVHGEMLSWAPISETCAGEAELAASSCA
jgi:hypothetical protein